MNMTPGVPRRTLKSLYRELQGRFYPEDIEPSTPYLEALQKALISVSRDFVKEVGHINQSYISRGAKGVRLDLGYAIACKLHATSEAFESQDAIITCIGLPILLWNFFHKLHLNNFFDELEFGFLPLQSSFPKLSIPPKCGLELIGTHEVNSADYDFNDRYSCRLFATSMRWILHHELAHLWNGHCDLRSQEFHGGRDVPKLVLDDNVDYVRAALEMDADTRAAQAILPDIIGLYFQESGEVLVDEELVYDRFWARRVFLACFVCFSVILIVELYSKNISRTNTKPSYYPSFYYRKLTFSRVLNKMTEFLPNAHQDTVWRQLDMAYKASAFAVGQNMPFQIMEILNHIKHSDVSTIDKGLIEGWNRVQPLLSEVKRGLRIVGLHN